MPVTASYLKELVANTLCLMFLYCDTLSASSDEKAGDVTTAQSSYTIVLMRSGPD